MVKNQIISAQALSIRGNDIDTDRIIPARFVKTLSFDNLGQHLFAQDRSQQQQQRKLHPLDNPAYTNAQILFVNKNFGCGSSREHAPQAIARWGRGIQAIVGESFAEIFLGNCTALGLICGTADEVALQKLMRANESNPQLRFYFNLEELTIAFENQKFPVFIPDGLRQQLYSGDRDSLAELLQARNKIAPTAAQLPYFHYWQDIA
jgi:3-isopropylmalate/(R)-2-methylmalate dehydratase small subunit